MEIPGKLVVRTYAPARRWITVAIVVFLAGVALYVMFELGRYKTTHDYRRFRHKERHMANASFALGMVASIADKLTAMKVRRDEVNNSTGRDLVVFHDLTDGRWFSQR